MKKSVYLTIVDALCLQAAWFSAALLQDSATPWLCALLLLRIGVEGFRWPPLRAAGSVAAAGLLLEFLTVQTGLSRYNSATLLPLWLPLLWLLFGYTFARSLSWLGQLGLPLQSGLGALAGTLTYFSAHAFGVLQLKPSTYVAALCLAALWAMALPFFATLHRHTSESTKP